MDSDFPTSIGRLGVVASVQPAFLGSETNWIESRVGWTPYDGKQVTGWPVGTFVRGRRVMWQGELVTPSQGQPMRFLEAL